MIKKGYLFVILGIVVLFSATFIHAGTKVDDVIRMENKAYTKHTKGIAEFSHKKHIEEYGAGCGKCHHDENNKPLDNIKMGDNVQNCIECHKIPANKPKKKKDAPKLTRSQELEYHAVAIHYNCWDCHKTHNKEKGLKSKDPGYAPTKSKCKVCHPKE